MKVTDHQMTPSKWGSNLKKTVLGVQGGRMRSRFNSESSDDEELQGQEARGRKRLYPWRRNSSREGQSTWLHEVLKCSR